MKKVEFNAPKLGCDWQSNAYFINYLAFKTDYNFGISLEFDSWL